MGERLSMMLSNTSTTSLLESFTPASVSLSLSTASITSHILCCNLIFWVLV